MNISNILLGLLKFAISALAREAATALAKSVKIEEKALQYEKKAEAKREVANQQVAKAERVETLAAKLKEVDL